MCGRQPGDLPHTLGIFTSENFWYKCVIFIGAIPTCPTNFTFGEQKNQCTELAVEVEVSRPFPCCDDTPNRKFIKKCTVVIVLSIQIMIHNLYEYSKGKLYFVGYEAKTQKRLDNIYRSFLFLEKSPIYIEYTILKIFVWTEFILLNYFVVVNMS